MTNEHDDFPKKVGGAYLFQFEICFSGDGDVDIDVNRDYQLGFSIFECIERFASALGDDGCADDYLLNVANDFADISRRLRAMADPAKATAYLETL
jgi:hypothetical protein